MPSGDLTPGYGAATAARTVVVALSRAGRLVAALLLLGTVLLVVTLVNQTVVAAAAPSSASPAAAASVADRQVQIGNLPHARTPAEPEARVVAWQRYAWAWDESVRELFRAGRQLGPGGLAAAGLRRSIPPTRGDGSGSHVPGVPPTFAWSWQGSGPRLGRDRQGVRAGTGAVEGDGDVSGRWPQDARVTPIGEEPFLSDAQPTERGSAPRRDVPAPGRPSRLEEGTPPVPGRVDLSLKVRWTPERGVEFVGARPYGEPEQTPDGTLVYHQFQTEDGRVIPLETRVRGM